MCVCVRGGGETLTCLTLLCFHQNLHEDGQRCSSLLAVSLTAVAKIHNKQCPHTTPVTTKPLGTMSTDHTCDDKATTDSAYKPLDTYDGKAATDRVQTTSVTKRPQCPETSL